VKKHAYRTGKIKTKHHIIKEAIPFLNELAKLDFIKLIVPDVINNNSHGNNRIRISKAAENGFDLTFGGAGAQKYHVVCEPSKENRERIEKVILNSGKRGS
jgi:hypothetical protein